MKYSYEKHGVCGTLEVGLRVGSPSSIMRRLSEEGLKFTLLTREIFSPNEVKPEGWKRIERLDDEQLERKKVREEEMKRLKEEQEKRRERMTRRLSLQRPSSQAPQNKKDDAGKAGNDGSANQGKNGK